MRVLVTGGTGFVGSHLVEQLVAGGNEVSALVRPGSNRALLRKLGAQPLLGDLDDAASLHAACEGCEIVYHAAARVEITGRESEFFRTTVEGTARLAEAARRTGVRRFVYVSSCGVYHPDLLASGRPIDETTPTREPPRWFAYGRAKFHAEQVVMSGIVPPQEWTIIRLGYLYGPRNRTMRTYLEPLMRQGIMRIIGNGENEMAMIYVEDAVRAILLAGKAPEAAGQVLIATADERITQQQYFNALADGYGVERPTRRIPYPLAFLCGWIGEFIALGFRRAVIRRSAVALTGLPQRLHCERTRRLLGWRPQVKFADGIRRAFDWYWSEFGEAPLAPAADHRSAGASA